LLSQLIFLELSSAWSDDVCAIVQSDIFVKYDLHVTGLMANKPIKTDDHHQLL
jgi:hypothetical protein